MMAKSCYHAQREQLFIIPSIVDQLSSEYTKTESQSITEVPSQKVLFKIDEG